MFENDIKVANEIIHIKYNFKETSEYLKGFYCSVSSDECVVIDNDRLIYETQYLRQRFPTKRFLDFMVEYNAIYRDVALILLKKNVFLVHGVLLKINNIGILFMAPSGTGKSTHARLWLNKFGDKATILNGDKPLLKVENGHIVAYGSPWKGKEKIGNGECVRLEKICIIKRANRNSICRLAWNAKSFSFLLSECLVPELKAGISAYINCIKLLSSATDLYELHCNISEESVEVAYDGLFGGTYLSNYYAQGN